MDARIGSGHGRDLRTAAAEGTSTAAWPANPLPSAAPDPLAGHQELPQYYVEVETILCGLQMNQMSCIEQTLLQTMLKNKSIKTMLKKKSKKAGASIPRLLACFALKGIPRKNRRPHQPRVSCVG